MEKSCWLAKNICWCMADATMTGSMFFVACILIHLLGVEENKSNLSSDRTDKVLLSIVCMDNFGLLILYLEAAEKTQKSSQSCGCSATEQSKLRSQITNATSHLPFLSRNSSYQIAEQIPPPPFFFLGFVGTGAFRCRRIISTSGLLCIAGVRSSNSLDFEGRGYLGYKKNRLTGGKWRKAEPTATTKNIKKTWFQLQQSKQPRWAWRQTPHGTSGFEHASLSNIPEGHIQAETMWVFVRCFASIIADRSQNITTFNKTTMPFRAIVK